METPNEMLDRVRRMADLSDADCAALKYVLGEAARVREMQDERASAWKIARQLAEALGALIAYADKTAEYWDHDEDSKVGKRLLWMAGLNKGYEPNMDHVHSALGAWKSGAGE